MTHAPSPTASRAVFPGILLISAATLLLEIAWMRVLSVTLWYHFAFMVLSTALFGFGFAGVVLALRKAPGSVPERLLGGFAVATPAAFAAGYVISNAIPFEPFSLGEDHLQWLFLPLFTLSVTLPFFCSGLTIAALITRHREAVHRLYLFDLLGAGAGALLVVFLLPALGGAGTVMMASGLAGAGALLVVWRRPLPWRAAAALLTVFAAGLSPFADQVLPVRVSGNKVTGDGVPLGAVFSDPRFHRFAAWNTASRVDVVEWRDRRRRVSRTIFIDGGTAVTRLAHAARPVSEVHPGNDDESFFLRLFNKPRVLVVGSGGGREVLLALRNDASRVTAVEINPDIDDLVRRRMADFTGELFRDPRVEAYADEARSFLGRSEERFDLIHCPHTISNAALASGSLGLAENYLLTLEAFGEYLSHLTPSGILLITRPEAHLPRLLATARAALENRGGESVAGRVMIWRRPSAGQSFYGGFALRKTPFTDAEVARFRAKLGARRLEPLYLPGRDAAQPYRDLAEGKALGKISLPFPAILTPATDDEPFFNRRIPFSDIGLSDLIGVFSRGEKGRMALEDRPVTEAALLLLLLETAVLALVFIIAPLAVFRRRAMAGGGQVPTIAAFFCLGLAYIFVEMGLVQKLALYLGKPVLVFATVFGTLLVSSGLGSAFAARFRGRGVPHRAALGAGAAALLVTLLLPALTGATLSASEPVRVLLAAACLAPPGFAMGMPFPLFIGRLDQVHPARIPWAFGINGFASVVGSIGAVLVAMTLGQTAVLFAGVAAYLAAAASVRFLTGRPFHAGPNAIPSAGPSAVPPSLGGALGVDR